MRYHMLSGVALRHRFADATIAWNLVNRRSVDINFDRDREMRLGVEYAGVAISE